MNPRPRRRPSWLRLLAVLVLAALGFVGVFGGPTLGRQMEDLGDKIRLNLFLHNCGRDELRFCSFMATSSGQSFRLTVNLRTGVATRSGGETRVKRGLFWQPTIQAVYSTISWPLNMPNIYSPEQLERIKTDLQAPGGEPMMPITIDPARFDNYAAFYRGTTLVICQEKGGKSGLPFRDLYRVLFLEGGSPTDGPKR